MQSFSHLKYLNLSDNALHTLDLEAFAKLRRLSELDLSNNRLEYLDERLFNRNKRLFKIDLSGNKFMSLSVKKLIVNPYLKELSLRNSQINMLHSELFAGLPNLLALDLSKNLLNDFNLEDFKYLTKLQKLNLSENFIKCNGDTKEKLKLLEQRHINMTLDGCFAANMIDMNQVAEHMFEKMIMFSSTADTVDRAEEENDSTSNNSIVQWRFHMNTEEIDESIEDEEDEEDSKNNFNSKKNLLRIKKNNEWLRFVPDSAWCGSQNYALCPDYRTCLQELNHYWHERYMQREHCPLSDIKFAFFLGLVIGISAVVIIATCVHCLRNCSQLKRQGKIVFL